MEIFDANSSFVEVVSKVFGATLSECSDKDSVTCGSDLANFCDKVVDLSGEGPKFHNRI